jgi:hypothetical protein
VHSQGFKPRTFPTEVGMLYSVEQVCKQIKKTEGRSVFQCALAGIQTPNLLIRSQMLYSVELRVLIKPGD